ncbi:MAG TPA: DMT family transporter [Bryobacteraceae bacterium]|jgi:drug/metabolite transporter (DMT)-like permease
MSGRAKAELALVVITLVWGATFSTVKNALADASPILFVAVRFSLASAALLLLYHRKLDRRTLLPGIAVGSLLFAGYAFQTVGLRFTTPSKAAFITGFTIPLVPLISSCVYKTRPRPAELAGVLAATVGMALMTLQDVHLQVSQMGLNPGDGLTVLCAVAFAGHIVALGYFSKWATHRRLGFEPLAVWQILTAAAWGLLSFRWLDTPYWHMSNGLWIALAITGLLATALAFTVQTWAQLHTTPIRTALIFALEPVFAWAFSWLLTGEVLSARASLGAVLILAGILLVEMKRSETGQHPSIHATSGVSTPEV